MDPSKGSRPRATTGPDEPPATAARYVPHATVPPGHLQTEADQRPSPARITTGWKITAADEAAIAQHPEQTWESSLKQDGDLHDDDHSGVAELTGLAGGRARWRACG